MSADEIEIMSNFEIWSGDELISKGHNDFTRYLKSTVVCIIGVSDTGYRDFGNYKAAGSAGASWGATCRVGRDTSTPTSPDMADLVDKINVAPSNIVRRIVRDLPDMFFVEYVFTWEAEVLPDDTIGEFGVYLSLDNDDWDSPLSNPSRYTEFQQTIDDYATIVALPYKRTFTLASRVASADGKFSAFYHYGSVDPLTYKWRFQVIIQ